MMTMMLEVPLAILRFLQIQTPRRWILGRNVLGRRLNIKMMKMMRHSACTLIDRIQFCFLWVSCCISHSWHDMVLLFWLTSILQVVATRKEERHVKRRTAQDEDDDSEVSFLYIFSHFVTILLIVYPSFLYSNMMSSLLKFPPARSVSVRNMMSLLLKFPPARSVSVHSSQSQGGVFVGSAVAGITYVYF